MTEPQISLHFEFENGSNPVVYYDKTIGNIGEIFSEWSVNWILQPVACSDFGDENPLWYFLLKERTNGGMSQPEFSPVLKDELASLYQ